MNEAVGHQLDRTDQEIVFQVVSSYYEVLLAARELEVAEQAAKTAQSITDRSQARFDSGLTVESDLLTQRRIPPNTTLSVTGQDSNAMFKNNAVSPFVSVACFRHTLHPVRTD